jgi:hypothetical protein
VSIANPKINGFHFSRTAAIPEPAMIPETESGKVRKRIASIQASNFVMPQK